MADNKIIKQIKTPDCVVYNINAFNADTLGGKSLTDIEGMVSGAIETYVIPVSASTASGYSTVVGATTAQVSTTAAILNGLTGTTGTTYRLGDVILMGATSDGTKNFDRWVSNVSGSGTSAVVTLDVLETQVAKHHHTISGSSKALTGISASTTKQVAKVGTAVTVTNDTGTYLTSVAYSTDASNKGGYDIDIETGTSTDGHAHAHSVNSHSHSIAFNPTTTLVSRTASPYTVLSTKTHATHTHAADATVAGATSNSTSITFVSGGSKDSFVTGIADDPTDSTTGGSGQLTTAANTAAKSTSAQSSTDTIGSTVLTVEAGTHSHSVSLATADEAVVTAATVATSVVTSVSYIFTKPSVAPTVVTGVTHTSKSVVGSASLTGTTTFFNGCSVDDSGVLSFTSATVTLSTSPATVASISSVATSTQTSGSLSISAPRSSQSRTLGKLTLSGTTENAGAHQHGFSHTHAIPTHTHTIATHTHTYKKQIASGTSEAYTSLSTSSFTPHGHAANATVAGAASTSDTITYVYGGDKTTVIRDLKNENLSGVSTGTTTATTGNAYLKVSASIVFPGLTVSSSKLSTTSITPAAAGETVLQSITFTSSSNFVAGTSVKTSTNIGGE